MSNPLTTLKNYADQMSISQVVLFFDRHGIHFTKTMIQNYIKIGLLTEPTNKRYYTSEHIVLLVWIDVLKSFYSLDDIKQLFSSVGYDTDELARLYDDFVQNSLAISDGFKKNLPADNPFLALAFLSLSKKIAGELL